MKQARIQHVPTNVITGFLGVGKTTAILNLLKQKPENETWAILVNEFGEIGVDGGLISGNHSEESGIYIKEVPGGCMCCTAGLPMQIALNFLLKQSRPDRLVIEPTGLGHPNEVLQALNAPHYQDVLSVQQTITLVDARQVSLPRYAENSTFREQIAIADKVVGNKQDLYDKYDAEKLEGYIKNHGRNDVEIILTSNGLLPLSALEGDTQNFPEQKSHHHHHETAQETVSDAPLPESGYLSANNSGEGYESIGWRFSPAKVFNKTKLFSFLSGLKAERMKAVFITDQGVFGYNMTSDTLTEIELDDCIESRIEIISEQVDNDMEAQILGCVLPTN